MVQDVKSMHIKVSKYFDKVKNIPKVSTLFWLFRCTDVLEKYINMSISPEGENRTAIAVLQVLIKYLDGIPQQTIANETGRTKQAITVAIDNLTKRGYVIRTQSSRDRRINCIQITKEGIDHLNEFLPRMLSICDEAFSSLSDSEIKKLLSLLKKLVKNVWEKTDSQSQNN